MIPKFTYYAGIKLSVFRILLCSIYWVKPNWKRTCTPTPLVLACCTYTCVLSTDTHYDCFTSQPSYINPVLEITVGHWPFSDQFQHLADQNPFWSAKFTVHFSMGWQLITYKMSYFQKTADQFLTLISTTVNPIGINNDLVTQVYKGYVKEV